MHSKIIKAMSLVAELKYRFFILGSLLVFVTVPPASWMRYVYKNLQVRSCISGPFSATIFAAEWIFPKGSHMLKKHLLLQLTATLRTGGVTKGKLHIYVVLSGAHARCCDPPMLLRPT